MPKMNVQTLKGYFVKWCKLIQRLVCRYPGYRVCNQFSEWLYHWNVQFGHLTSLRMLERFCDMSVSMLFYRIWQRNYWVVQMWRVMLMLLDRQSPHLDHFYRICKFCYSMLKKIKIKKLTFMISYDIESTRVDIVHRCYIQAVHDGLKATWCLDKRADFVLLNIGYEQRSLVDHKNNTHINFIYIPAYTPTYHVRLHTYPYTPHHPQMVTPDHFKSKSYLKL